MCLIAGCKNFGTSLNSHSLSIISLIGVNVVSAQSSQSHNLPFGKIASPHQEARYYLEAG